MAKDYEFTLPIGTVITGDVMPDGNGQHYQYHIESVLGQGGFGITYKVWSIVKNGRISAKMQFAIKEHFVKGRCHRGSDGVTVEYSREAAEDVEDSLKDFIKEGRLLQSICQVKDPSDPRNAGYQHIVPVNEVIEVNNTAYFVMQFLDGGSLRDMVLESGSGMDESKALSLMVPVCQAVEYIHSHGILHMDIKPENIVMRRNLETTQEEPVLIDFGVSLHFDKKGSLTTTHTSFGRTEGFSPMEQYGEISSFQPKIDVYALGATMFYLLSGKTPPSAFNVTQDFLEKNLPESVSERTRKAVLHAMSRDSHERTSSAKAFISELENRFTLPVGYVLHGPNCDYLLTAIHDVQSCYIRYDAVVYTGSARRANDRNMTVTTQYYVYECYSKQSCERHDDGTVSGKGGGDVDYRLQDSFLSEACQVTGLESVGDCEKSDVRVEREIFKGHGTLYAVVDKRYKPASGLSKAMDGVTKSLGDATKSIGGIADSLKKHAKTIGMIVAGIVLVGGAILLGPAVIKMFQKTDADWTRDLNKAIEQKDFETLQEFADKDSARAILPLSSLYLQKGDTVNALKYADMAFTRDMGLDTLEARNIIQSIHEYSAAEQQKRIAEAAEQARKDSLARVAQAEAEAQNATEAQAAAEKQKQEEAQKKAEEAKKKQEEAAKQAEAKKKQEEQKKQDEANKKVSDQAYAAKMALQYVNGARTYENHKKAYEWAQKADATTRAQVVKKLQEMDFPIP